MQLRIGNLVISKKGVQLIFLIGFVQGLVLGAYYAATEGWKDVPLPIIYMFVLPAVVILYGVIRKEITIRKK